MKERAQTLWRENKGFIAFIVLMLIFRSAVADWNDVPSGSMKPTILEGDRLLINKMAYDIRVPFTTQSLVHLDDPVSGEIVIFESKVADKRLVKRVIGVPGDQVAMVDNQVIVNGQPLSYVQISQTADTTDYTETLNGKSHSIRVKNGAHMAANFDSVTVPAGHYLVLGDNRDNSADSRYIGFVPRTEIIGRSRQLALSLDYDNYFLPRGERFLMRL